ncbi:hypothetical protein [Paractinoplanes rishiriensis]|uniref:Lipoprotein n=1 Tax=Paractinoplanes rishiriensis TaxID=1050105 RepID=A0A919JXJ1_9ACTN|nr:hypothetical protein [Actinoplanes rishiriensis]GIE95074.1 hypothetical protein Ari01nite_25390 [Actinoplanes rishiriensis]
MLRRLAVLLATVTLTAGCGIEVKADAIPVPFSVAPTPSASAGVPEYVCTAAYKILTDGAVHLAGFVSGSGDSAEQGIRDTFTGMAAQVTAEAERTTDAELKQALGTVAADLTAGAKQADPRAYVDGGFATVGQKLDAAC